MSEYPRRPEKPVRALLEAELVQVTRELEQIMKKIKYTIEERAKENEIDVRQEINRLLIVYYEERSKLLEEQQTLREQIDKSK